MMKSRRMRWAGHVTYMGEKGNAYKILVESRKERDHGASFIDICVDFGVGVDAMDKRKISSLPDIDKTVTVKQYEFIVVPSKPHTPPLSLRIPRLLSRVTKSCRCSLVTPLLDV
jgi:hypothetical protein